MKAIAEAKVRIGVAEVLGTSLKRRLQWSDPFRGHPYISWRQIWIFTPPCWHSADTFFGQTPLLTVCWHFDLSPLFFSNKKIVKKCFSHLFCMRITYRNSFHLIVCKNYLLQRMYGSSIYPLTSKLVFSYPSPPCVSWYVDDPKPWKMNHPFYALQVNTLSGKKD